jgi:hypothetical protein
MPLPCGLILASGTPIITAIFASEQYRIENFRTSLQVRFLAVMIKSE